MANPLPVDDFGRARHIDSLTSKIQRLLLRYEPLTVWYRDGTVWPDSVEPGDVETAPLATDAGCGVIVGTYVRDTPRDWIKEDLEEVLDQF